MTKTELEILAKILKEYSEEYGDHSCNDMELPNTPEMRKFVMSAEMSEMSAADKKYYEIGTNANGNMIIAADFVIADYLRKRVLEELKTGE